MERYNNIIEFEEISSTNDYAIELVRSKNVLDFTVIKTEFQTKGRGQIGNHWVSDKGKNLLFSLILHPTHIPANNQFILSQCVALALRDVVANFCELVTVKWPNDIYVGNKKIAGILIENVLKGKNIESSIIGIGLNVNQSDFADVPNPTSLQNEFSQDLNRDEILQLFLSSFENYYLQSQNDKSSVQEKYLQNLYLLNTQNLFKDKDGLFFGEITSVASDGKLQITDGQGRNRQYYFKEVEFVINS